MAGQRWPGRHDSNGIVPRSKHPAVSSTPDGSWARQINSAGPCRLPTVGIGFHPAGIRCRLVDGTECPVLTRVAACVSSPSRLARIADFPVAERTAAHGRPALPGLRDADPHAGAAPWPSITAVGPTSIQVPEESPPSAPAASGFSTARPSRWRHLPDWPVALSERRWDEYTHRRLPTCWSGRPPRGNSSPHSSASSNGRILQCWVSLQP